MITEFQYDKHFTTRELREIRLLRWWDDHRWLVAWAVSIGLGAGVPAITIFVGVPPGVYLPINAVAILGFPVFLFGTYFLSDWVIETRFSNKWDEIYYKRSGDSYADSVEREVMSRLTDSMEFMALTNEQQKRIAAEEIAKARKRLGDDA